MDDTLHLSAIRTSHGLADDIGRLPLITRSFGSKFGKLSRSNGKYFPSRRRASFSVEKFLSLDDKELAQETGAPRRRGLRQKLVQNLRMEFPNNDHKIYFPTRIPGNCG